jgi:hypothetical protein
MKILELFAGSRSIGKAAESLGHEVFSVDVKPFEKIDLVKDIEELEIDDIPFVPEMIWASPPCTTFSLAGISHHRKEGTLEATSEFAKKSDRLVQKTLEIIHHFEKFGAVWYIENPRATLRKMEFMKGLPRVTIWYCRYKSNIAKPTDIFSNNIFNPLFNSEGWKPKPECWNNNKKCHHESAPRGSRTGLQGLKGNYERSKIPHELCIDVIKSAEYYD